MVRVFSAVAVLLALAGPVMAQDSSKPPAAGAPAPAAGGKPAPAVAAPPAAISQCPDNMSAFAGSSEVLTCSCPAEMTRGGSVWGTDTYTADSRTCRAALHAGAVTTAGGPVTVRMLPGQARYPGTTRNGVATSNYAAYDATFRFEGVPTAAAPSPGAASPQAAAPQSIGQCPDNMAAYSGSAEVIACTCPANLAASGSVWGSDTYTADSRTCRAALHAGAISARGGDVTVRMLPGQPRYLGTTRNGVATTNYGPYDGSFRFDGVQPAAAVGGSASAQDLGQCPDNMAAFQGSTDMVSCTCTAMMTRDGSVWGSDTYTADSRTCRAAVHAGAVPLSGGRVTITMLPGATIHPGTTRNGVSTNNYGAYDTSFRFEGVQAASGPGVCPDNMSAYASSGEQLRCSCPAEATRSGSVWGTDIYTADSRTCVAARHAGAVGPNGGAVSLRMLEGQARYPGTTRNGVSSNNYGAYAASFQFEGVRAAGPALCPDNMTAYGGSTEVLVCLCPGEATLSGTVWGSDTYTADSRTCRAAVHAGAIPLTGGLVKLTMAPGAPRYLGTTRNGVSSNNYGPYDASYRIQSEGPRASGPVQAPVAAQLRATGTVALYITFRTNSADLDANAVPVLTQVRDALQADPALRLRLVGHTDDTGNDGINIPLSGRRAESVRAWLVANGVSPERLGSEGRGATQPIAGNGDEMGRSLNRRVQAVRVN